MGNNYDDNVRDCSEKWKFDRAKVRSRDRAKVRSRELVPVG
jgi:hypothetical protein